MNAPAEATAPERCDAQVTDRGSDGAGAASERRRRALAAQYVLARAPAAAAELDWDALAQAPDWLVAQGPAFECRVGAMLCVAEIRLWIDAPRLAAARRVLGASFLQALLAQPDSPGAALLAPLPRIVGAEQVAPRLREVGASVVLAALADGALGAALEQALAPLHPLPIAAALAQSLVERTAAMAGAAEQRKSE
jgi:hypothetical protein